MTPFSGLTYMLTMNKVSLRLRRPSFAAGVQLESCKVPSLGGRIFASNPSSRTLIQPDVGVCGFGLGSKGRFRTNRLNLEPFYFIFYYIISYYITILRYAMLFYVILRFSKF